MSNNRDRQSLSLQRRTAQDNPLSKIAKLFSNSRIESLHHQQQSCQRPNGHRAVLRVPSQSWCVPFNHSSEAAKGRTAAAQCCASHSSKWWSRTGSNRRPEACKATALPTELRPLLLVSLKRRQRHPSPWLSAPKGAAAIRPLDACGVGPITNHSSQSSSCDSKAVESATARRARLRVPKDKWWAWDDSNVRPHPYQGCALTT